MTFEWVPRWYACMYVCMVITYSRVWINRVRLPILLVVSRTGKMNIPLSPCVPENLVPRDGFSRPVPRQPAHLHTQAESGAYLRDSSRVPRRRPFMKPPYATGSALGQQYNVGEKPTVILYTYINRHAGTP